MLRLLDALNEGTRRGYVEIRSIKDGKVDQAFLAWPGGKKAIEEVVREKAKTHDVYYGVLLRKHPAGKAEDCYPTTRWLWADIDKKGGATFASLLRFPTMPRPQIVVDSGRGWHLYWRLDHYVHTGVAQETMASIAALMGGDMVGDPARILRAPGTWNRKDPDNPIPVRILRMKDLKHGYALGDFPYLPAVARGGKRATGPTGMKGTRSEDLFKIALEGIRKGLSDDEIETEMLADPAGSKLTEMTKAKADRWIALTLRKARASISTPSSA